MPSIIGVDLGGTKIAAARYDADTWKLQEEKLGETHAEEAFSHVEKDMIAIIRSLKQEDTQAVGIGVPGLVKQPEGTIVTLPNIPKSENRKLKSDLQHTLDMNIAIDNDANCFALAEALQGAGQGHSVVVGITMGTGVGGGIVIDGRLFTGAHGFAAEIGHMLLKPGEPAYETDDKRGDVEQFLSGSAMGKRCEAAGSPEDYLKGEVCSFMRPDIFREVSWMCVNIIHLLDPSVIVFGGSAGHALKDHIKEIEKELSQWLLPGTPLPDLKIAELKDAPTLGAALLVT